MPWEYTSFNLTPEECSQITAHATGRALEFGSGHGLGTHALLAARCHDILSIDDDGDFTLACAARFLDPRVTWLQVPLLPNNGWYQTVQIPPPEPEARYDTVLLDGPSGLAGRHSALEMLIEGNYLADDWRLIVTHTAEAAIQTFVTKWFQNFSVQSHALSCPRGMLMFTPVP